MKTTDEKLHTSSRDGDLEKVKEALGEGADINAREKYGDTALNIASEYGHKDIVETLINAGADIENKGGADKTPVMNAAFSGHMQIVQLLVENGALINNDLMSSIQMKVNILEENAESGMVTQEGVDAWKQFHYFLKKTRMGQDLPQILEALSSDDPEIAGSGLASIETAANMGLDISPSLDRLNEFLSSGDGETRVGSAASITSYHVLNKNWEIIKELCKSNDHDVLLGIMSVFVWTSKSGFDITPLIDDIISMMRSSWEDIRHDAPIVTGYLATEGYDTSSALSAVIETLDDSVPDIRQMACWALYRMARYGHLDISASVHRLKELVEDDDSDVSSMAAEALGVSGSG